VGYHGFAVFSLARVLGKGCFRHSSTSKTEKMAPDTSMQAFVNASAASMSLPTIPRSPRTLRDMTLDEELVDPDAKLILSDFTQSTPQGLSIY